MNKLQATGLSWVDSKLFESKVPYYAFGGDSVNPLKKSRIQGRDLVPLIQASLKTLALWSQ